MRACCCSLENRGGPKHNRLSVDNQQFSKYLNQTKSVRCCRRLVAGGRSTEKQKVSELEKNTEKRGNIRNKAQLVHGNLRV